MRRDRRLRLSANGRGRKRVARTYEDGSIDQVAEERDVFLVRALGRLPLGTPYPGIAEHVTAEVARLNASGVKPVLRIDATGVGRPLNDILRDELRDHRCTIVEVTFTAGEPTISGGWHSAEVRCPKLYAVSRLQALVQTRRIRWPRSCEADQLVRELETFELRISDTGATSAGAFKTGTHDDLVTAAALAALFDRREGTIEVMPSIWT